MKTLYFRSIALLGALCSISLSLFAVPTREVATVKPGKVLDVGTMKPLFHKTNRVAVGPVTRKKAIVLEADRDLFKEKSTELLSGANEIYRRGIAEVTKR